MTIGTRLFTLWKGKLVGNDDAGNRYYRERNPAKGRRGRRWVIYNGEVEASRVPPRWHAWLHYSTDALPDDQEIPPRPWEREHQANLTGSEGAWHPRGHVLEGGARAPASGDYEPWTPS